MNPHIIKNQRTRDIGNAIRQPLITSDFLTATEPEQKRPLWCRGEPALDCFYALAEKSM